MKKTFKELKCKVIDMNLFMNISSQEDKQGSFIELFPQLFPAGAFLTWKYVTFVHDL